MGTKFFVIEVEQLFKTLKKLNSFIFFVKFKLLI